MSGTSNAYRAIVVDDQSMFRQTARRILEGDGEFIVVGDTDSGDEAIRLADRLLPDLVLMDIHLGEMSGFEVARRLKAKHPQMQVVLLSMFAEEEYVRLSSLFGALGFISKRDFTPKTLRQLLETKSDRPDPPRHAPGDQPGKA